jgi:hypothetical protein
VRQTRGDLAAVAGLVFDQRHQPRQGPAVAASDLEQQLLRLAPERMPGALDHIGDHAFQAQSLAVVRGIDAGHAAGVQLGNLLRHDHTAAAAEHADLLTAALAQHLHHVFEEFDVPALVGAHGDTVGIFLQGGGDDLLHAAVVTEMDHLRPQAHQQAADDVDAGVMAVEQAGCRDKAQRRPGLRVGHRAVLQHSAHGF